MVVAKESVGSSGTSITLEDAMRVESADDCRWRQGASEDALPSNTEQVSDRVSINDERGVGDETSSRDLHIETYTINLLEAPGE